MNTQSAVTPFRWPEGRRAAVSLTFDDARASQVEKGIPILNRHGIRATFYVAVGNVEPRVAAWKAAVAAGHEIGNHTIRHPCSANFCWSRDSALEDYTLAGMEAEILEANDRIRDLLGVVPRTFAYPCGQTFVGRGVHCASYIPVVARRFLAGRGFLSETFNDPARCDLAQLCGSAADGLSFDELRLLADRTAADGGWLVLCGHEVGEDGGGQTTGAEVLDQFCEYAVDASSGLWVDAVAAVADHVNRCRGIES